MVRNRDDTVKRVRLDHPSASHLDRSSTAPSSTRPPHSLPTPTPPPLQTQHSGTSSVPESARTPTSASGYPPPPPERPYSEPYHARKSTSHAPTAPGHPYPGPPPPPPSTSRVVTTSPDHSLPLPSPSTGSTDPNRPPLTPLTPLTPQHPAFHPPVYGDSRPAYGQVTQPSPHAHPQELPASSRPPISPNQPDQPRDLPRAPLAGEWQPHSSSMEGHATSRPPPQPMYGPVPVPPPVETNPNGVPLSVTHPHHGPPPPGQHHPPPGHGHPQGMPGAYPVQPPEGYGQPMPPPNYPQTPTMQGFAQPVFPNNGPTMQQHVKPRKSVRAQMACNQCRQRKQKCDEKTPCSWCSTEGVECTYRDPPPPKADRNMTQLLEWVGGIVGEIKALRSDMNSIKAESLSKGRRPTVSSVQASLKQEEEESTMPEEMDTSPFGESNEETSGEVRMADALPSGESPELHSTGAHNLFDWPTIRQFYMTAGIQARNYPDELEQQQGVLRLYSSGSSGDRLMVPPPTSGGSSSAQLAYTYPSPSDDAIYGSDWEGYKTGSQVPRHHIGGLNSDRYIRLDADTVMKLHDSYMNNMWIIFPIIPIKRLRTLFTSFIGQYSPQKDDDEEDAHTPVAYDSPYNGSRKRPRTEDTSKRGHAYPAKKKVDHSVNNAITLLVMALGKLCEHDKFLKIDQTVYADNYKQSPGGADLASTPSPGYNVGRSGVGSRSSSIERASTSGTDPKSKEPLNVDVYPGLAYYTEASQILGALTGGRDLSFAHAYILAALYMGQIGRVYSAYDWVSRAANIMVELRRKHEDKLLISAPNDSSKDLARQSTETADLTETLALTFWTIHQMEGDIRAELDNLPQSGLATLVGGPNETTVRFPMRLPTVDDENLSQPLFRGQLDVKEVLFHFNAQLYVRKILNRIHATLYGENANRNNSTEVLELWEQVQQWRPQHPMAPAWNDTDAPATDILNARLRAKYYGAAYIVNRPWLQSVLNPPSTGPLAEDRKLVINDYDEVLKRGFERDTDFLSTMDLSNDFARAVGCRRCILAALHSTVAFDGLIVNDEGRIASRPKLTNIQGTAAAQFSNMLVVSNAYLEPVLRPLVPEGLFFPYLQRTIDLLSNLSPVSPIFKKHREVLDAAQRRVEAAYRDFHQGQNPQRYPTRNHLAQNVFATINGVGNTVNTSFTSTSASAGGSGSGRGRGGSVSGPPGSKDGSGSAEPGTPTYYVPGSVHSSFGATR